MASNKAEQNAMDYPAHENSYGRFLTMLKFGTIASAIVGLVVVLIIAN